MATADLPYGLSRTRTLAHVVGTPASYLRIEERELEAGGLN